MDLRKKDRSIPAVNDTFSSRVNCERTLSTSMSAMVAVVPPISITQWKLSWVKLTGEKIGASQ